MTSLLSHVWTNGKGYNARSYVTTSDPRQIPGLGALEFQILTKIPLEEQASHGGATHVALKPQSTYTKTPSTVFSGSAKDVNGHPLGVLAILHDTRLDSSGKLMPQWELITSSSTSKQVWFHTAHSVPPESERFGWDGGSEDLLDRIAHFDPASFLPGPSSGGRPVIGDLEWDLATTSLALRDGDGDLVIGTYHLADDDKQPAYWMLRTFPYTHSPSPGAGD